MRALAAACKARSDYGLWPWGRSKRIKGAAAVLPPALVPALGPWVCRPHSEAESTERAFAEDRAGPRVERADAAEAAGEPPRRGAELWATLRNRAIGGRQGRRRS